MANPAFPWNIVSVPYDGRTAAVRYNNPGAQYPSPAASRFGMEGYGVIGGGHKIAKFPTEAHGAAANMDNFARNYRGMTLGDAVRKWRGGNGSTDVPEGFDPSAIVDDSFIGDRERMTQFFDKMARHEGRGAAGPVNPETWRQGYDLFKGSPSAPPPEPLGSPPAPASQSPVRLASSAQGNESMMPMLSDLFGLKMPGAQTPDPTMAGGGSAGAGMGGSPMGNSAPFSMGGGGGQGGDVAAAQLAMKTAAGGPDQSMFAGPSQAARPVDLQQLMASLAKRQKLGLGGMG